MLYAKLINLVNLSPSLYNQGFFFIIFREFRYFFFKENIFLTLLFTSVWIFCVCNCYLVVLVTGLLCSAILKKLSKKASNVKEQLLSNDLEQHSK